MNTNHNDSTKQFIIDQLKWLGIYISIGFVLSFFLPFPISLVAALGIYMLINFYIRKRMLMKRYSSIERMKNLFDSLSPSFSTSGDGYNPIKYYCMNCGREHKEISCPNCGSNMKRIGT